MNANDAQELMMDLLLRKARAEAEKAEIERDQARYVYEKTKASIEEYEKVTALRGVVGTAWPSRGGGGGDAS